MTHMYYVDLENVQANGLRGSGKINKDDNVYIFYSEHAKPRIPFEIAQEIALSKGTFSFREVVKLGKDAMDKVLIKAVRKHMKKHDNIVYHIISKDKGYRKEFRDMDNVVYQAKIK